METVQYKIITGDNLGWDTWEEVFIAPKHMSFYKIPDTDREITYNKTIYGTNTWIGISPYTEEYLKIAGNEDDPESVINPAIVYNIGNKYLIWELKDIWIDESTFNTIDTPPIIQDEVYIVQKIKSELEEDQLLISFAEISKQNPGKITEELIDDFFNKHWKPFRYIKILGLNPNGLLDCIAVTIKNSNLPDMDILNISREDIEPVTISFEYHKNQRIDISGKEEFEKVFNETLNKIRDENNRSKF